ncbi:MAG: F0F1 ATP synthase subunit A [Gammaproteobacteria bacterium]
MATEESGGMTGYIKHHLQHMEVGGLHLDSIVIKVLLALFFVVLFLRVARRATPGVPGKLQCFIEMLVEFVDQMVKETFHGRGKMVAPLAITIFCLVFLMNFMDMLPVDLLPGAYQALSPDPYHAYLRVVPTADLNTTLGMAVMVFLLIQYYGIKHKGVATFFGEFLTAPFHAEGMVGKALCAVPNLLLRLIEEAVRPVSLSLRLFGNMYGGELIFILIACMTLGASLTSGLTYVMAPVQFIAGFIWTAFHVLVITLQAFIFMMLTLVYVGQAHESH